MRAICFILPLLAVAGCGGKSPTVAPSVTAQQQASAASSMGLSFPAETQFLLYHRASEGAGMPGPDDAVHLKIQLTKPGLAEFLAQAPFDSAQWSTSLPDVRDVPQWAEWQPSKITKFRSEQFSLPNGEAINVLIDDDTEEPKTVYLLWFET